MNLNAIRMFAATAQSGSLTAAAERLSIPLATISRRIRDLERELNVQLLQRSVHGTCLTDAGRRLYQHASRGLEILRRLLGDPALFENVDRKAALRPGHRVATDGFPADNDGVQGVLEAACYDIAVGALIIV